MREGVTASNDFQAVKAAHGEAQVQRRMADLELLNQRIMKATGLLMEVRQAIGRMGDTVYGPVPRSDDRDGTTPADGPGTLAILLATVSDLEAEVGRTYEEFDRLKELV